VKKLTSYHKLLIDYTPEVKLALEKNDETKLYEIFSTESWKSHLTGYRLQLDSYGKKRVISTPLLDIIQRFPLLAGKLFYKMMEVESVVGQTTRVQKFDEFDLAIVNQAKTVRNV